jgi:hypothetical protein
MKDMIDLASAAIQRSPADIASWPITLTITRVQEDPHGGFALTFDRPVPAAWKWPSNPAVPSDNFQFTVWAFIKSGGRWTGAGFVQMWEGRPMTGGELPAIFTVHDGAPGYVNWWGDVRRIWTSMVDYVPQPGDTIGLMVSAGNGRLVDGVTSVRERSNVVTVALPANDTGVFTFQTAAVPGGEPAPPPASDTAAALAALMSEVRVLRQELAAAVTLIKAVRPPSFSGTVTQSGEITLHPDLPKEG